jgi:prepilin-type N-terminal cleavage/methylation domain-containing protein
MTRPGSDAGFTLLELLVALTLSALVAVVLLHGIRVSALGLDRHTQQTERLDAQQSLDDILRRTLGAAVLIPRPAGGEFIGKPDAIEFLAAAEDSGPGLYRINLAVDTTRSDRPLILKRQLLFTARDSRATASILAVNVRDLRLAYFGADTANADPVWHDDWQQLNLLPLMVRVIVDSDGDPMRPPLAVRLWSGGA